jgi:hypothetical protein
LGYDAFQYLSHVIEQKSAIDPSGQQDHSSKSAPKERGKDELNARTNRSGTKSQFRNLDWPHKSSPPKYREIS